MTASHPRRFARRLAASSPFAIVLACLVAPAARAQFSQFNWTLAGNPSGSGSLTATTMHVVGPNLDLGGCLIKTTQFETTIPADGLVSVDVDFTNLDKDAGFDAPCAVLDGVVIKADILVGSGWPTGPYHLDVPVEAGQVLGLGVWSTDCIEGPGIGDFKNFVFAPNIETAVPLATDVRTRFSISALGKFGTDAARLGDLDGDGRDDIVVIAPAPASPTVQVLSGDDGAQLLALSSSSMNGATAVASAGDFDHDGKPDFVVGMPGFSVTGKPDAGRCEVRSGADGHLLFGLLGPAAGAALGTAVAPAGDVDADGFDDVLVGQPGTPGTIGAAFVFGGPDGHLVWTLSGSTPGGLFGAAVAAGGDADDDGLSDLLIGEPGWMAGARGAAHVVSGGSHTDLITPTGSGSFGASVAWAGDVDGDGHDDMLVGAPLAAGEGLVALYSGASAALLLAVPGGSPDAQFGRGLAGGADLTGDGLLDFAASALTSDAMPTIQVRSAATGALEQLLSASSTLEGLPASTLLVGVDIVSDLNGDGLQDLIASATTTDVDQGTVTAFHNLDHKPPLAIYASGHPLPGSIEAIQVDGLKAAANLVLVLGGTELSAPFKGGVLYPNPLLLVPLVASPAGHVSVSATWPAGLPQWTSVLLQGWTPDVDGPAGWVCTDGLKVTQIVP